MAKIHEIQGYVVVLDKIVHITRVFEADNEGAQFNIRMSGDSRLMMKYPDRAQATLERDLLIQALEQS